MNMLDFPRWCLFIHASVYIVWDFPMFEEALHIGSVPTAAPREVL